MRSPRRGLPLGPVRHRQRIGSGTWGTPCDCRVVRLLFWLSRAHGGRPLSMAACTDISSVGANGAWSANDGTIAATSSGSATGARIDCLGDRPSGEVQRPSAPQPLKVLRRAE